jgi:hypothetical protein
MCTASHAPPLVYAALGWAGGALSTAVLALIASKIHVYHANRDAHRDAIKDKVLTPLRACLEVDFEPLVRFAAPIISPLWTEVAFKKDARSTEDQTERAEVLIVANPWPAFKLAADTALYQDAKAKHFSGLIRKAEEFAAAWEGYAESLREWIQEMAQRIARATNFAPLQDWPGIRPYAAHDHLAVFAYKRVCRLQAGYLSKGSTGTPMWSLTNASVTVAMSSPELLDGLIATMDALIVEQQSRGDFFVNRAKQLAAQLDAVKSEVWLALASTKLPEGCNLVKFW